ncbi:uncharacterized protein LOC130819095 [Amaranthus tricolor]|uniref:uncharacterized protein LOC130819095 n=1 Tax=Amaranthus tricolor TaxID=29722 RepID=UPI00258B3594|nr:uncharacterized protein LOC130819095 [Amaranthus tricolor]
MARKRGNPNWFVDSRHEHSFTHYIRKHFPKFFTIQFPLLAIKIFSHPRLLLLSSFLFLRARGLYLSIRSMSHEKKMSWSDLEDDSSFDVSSSSYTESDDRRYWRYLEPP